MIEITKMPEDANENSNRCNCWLCGSPLVWMSDFSYSEVFDEGEGIVSYLKCTSCGAVAEFSRRDDIPEETLIDDNTRQDDIQNTENK